MQKLKDEVSGILAPLTGLANREVAALLEVPPEQAYGDLAFPCFTLAKIFKKPPQAIAQVLAEKVAGSKGRFWEKVEPRGPYLNFYIAPLPFGREVLSEIHEKKDAYGHADIGRGRNVIVDYSSPNIAKPFGVGHIRSTVIGHALYLIYKAQGYNVIGINHLGDWGTQFGKLIVAYKRWGEDRRLEDDPVDYLYRLYVRFHREAENDPELDEEARSWFRRLENGDKDAVECWNRFRSLSLESYEKTYGMLGIQFEYFHGESHYNEMLERVINLVMEKGLARESDGALLIDLEPHGLPPVLLRKKDGATLYITRDIAAAMYRYERFNFARALYVVGAEQTLHFQQLFKVLELIGLEWADRCEHVPFGLISFKDGKMSTRAGRIVLLEEVLEKAVTLAREIIEEKNPGLADKESAAKAVGLGAIRFGDLSNDRIKNIEFDWDKVLDFSGETAAYVQYAHARICSILRKAGSAGAGWKEGSLIRLDAEEEIALVKTLALLPEKVTASAAAYRPSILARYLIDLARDFNRFYHNCPVLDSGTDLKEGRLLLIDGVRQVLTNGLTLLGIESPEEM